MRFSTIQNNSVLANISNVGTLVDLDGTLSANTGTMFTSIPFTQFPNYGISLVMNQSGNLSAYVNNMQIDWMIVSVYYTKTTDQQKGATMIKRPFGMAFLNITQGRFSSPGSSHHNINAYDLAGMDTGIDRYRAYYPLECISIQTDDRTGFANTVCFYDKDNDVTLAMTHVNEIPSGMYVGRVYDGGETCYFEGTEAGATSVYSSNKVDDLVGAVDTKVGTKANQTDLTALQGTVNSLQSTVSSKADQTDLTALQSTVGTKANQSELDTLEGTVSSLQTTVNNKADKSTVNAKQNKPTVKTITINTRNWSSGVYTLSDSLITATSIQEWCLPAYTGSNTAEINALQAANIVDAGQSAGKAKIRCLGTVPTVTVHMVVIFWG